MFKLQPHGNLRGVLLITPPPPPPPQRTLTDPDGPQRTCYEVIKTIIYLRELTEDDLSKKESKLFQKKFKNFSTFFSNFFFKVSILSNSCKYAIKKFLHFNGQSRIFQFLQRQVFQRHIPR